MLLSQRLVRHYANGIHKVLAFSYSTSALHNKGVVSSSVNCGCAHPSTSLQSRQRGNHALSFVDRFSTSTTALPNSRAKVTGSGRTERFQLLSHPQILLPSFDVGRRLANFCHQTYYMMRYEKEYSNEGFLRGVEQAVPLMAEYFLKENWQRMKNLTQSDLLADLRRLRADMKPSDLDCLKFESDDVVSSFVFASLNSKEWRLKQMLDTSRTVFVNHAVVYILRGEKDWLQKHPRPSPARLLAQQRKNLLVCNIQ
uniref:Tim44-like domain-containing protein n=1 Tax=Plectus sambesii TaxID=2011161 RepID=A0A914XKB7_9BILA